MLRRSLLTDGDDVVTVAVGWCVNPVMRTTTTPRSAAAFRRRTWTALGVSVLVLGPLAHAASSTPEGSRLDDRQRKATWQGATYAAAVTPDALGTCPVPAAATCDRHPLVVDVPAGSWSRRTGGVTVRVEWPSAEDDFDLFVYDAKGDPVASSVSSSSTFEEVVLNQPSGTYDVRVVPLAVTASSYTGSARLDTVDDARDKARSTWFQSRVADGSSSHPANAATRPFGPPLELRSNRTGLAAEPTLGVDRRGRAFLAALRRAPLASGAVIANETRVMRSVDTGRSWQDVTPSGAVERSPVSFDPYVHVDVETGRVLAVDNLLAGAFVSASDDGAQTWSPSVQAGEPVVNDHQTVTSGPLPRGSGAEGRAVYYCSQKELAATCASSADGGRTWRATGLPPYEVVRAADGQTCGALHGHAVVDHDGRLLLPAGWCDQPYLAVSEDGGLTWDRRLVAGAIGAAGPQTSVAVDDAGTYYYVFQDAMHRLPYLAFSKDAGQTWSRPVLLAPPGVRESGWPTIAAGAPGRVAVIFPGTAGRAGDATRPWDGHVLVSTEAHAAQPRWTATTFNAPSDPVHRGDCPLRCGNMLEFWDVVVAPSDGAVWGAAVDTCTGLRSCSTKRAAGYTKDELGLSESNGVADDAQGTVFVQVSGPQLRPRRGR